MKECPKCKGEVKEWDEAVYTVNGDVDQVVFRVCQKCGAEW